MDELAGSGAVQGSVESRALVREDACVELNLE